MARLTLVALVSMAHPGVLVAKLPQAKAKPQPVRCIAFSPDGKLLAVAAGELNESGSLTLWDLATKKPRWVHREQVGVPAVAFAPDGKTIAIGLFAKVGKLLDVQTGKVAKTLAGHNDAVRCVAFSPDGRRLITGSYDGTVKRWNVAAGKTEYTFKGHSKRIFSVAVSPDGDSFVSGGDDGAARVWELDGGAATRKFDQHRSLLRHVGWSPDGRWMLTSRWDGIVRIRDTGSWNLRARIRKSYGAECAILSSDGETLAVCDHRPAIRLYNLRLRAPDDKERRRIGKLIADWGNDDIRIRNKASKDLQQIGLICMPQIRETLKSDDPEFRIRARRLRDAVRSPKPSSVLKGHKVNVNYLAFSSNGEFLASGDAAGVVKLWNRKTRGEIATFRQPVAR